MTDESTPTPLHRGRGRPKGARNKGIRANAARTPRTRTATVTRIEQPGGIVATLRTQLLEQVRPCPTCGNPAGNKAKIARDIGLSTMSLSKFLKGGRVNSDTVDAIHSYLNQ